MAIPSYRSFTKAFDFTPSVASTPSKSTVNNISNMLSDVYLRNKRTYEELPRDRTLLDRGLDLLMTPIYTVAGFARGMVDNNYEGRQVTPFQGALEGIRAGNPFGEGYEKGEHTFSEVLEAGGWQPTSTAGKIAKGVVGFGLDVLLDPTTYLSGGATALLKGTGKAGLAATHLKPYVADVSKKYGINRVDDVKELPELVYKATKSKYAGNKEFNSDLIERLARKNADEVANEVAIFTNGLTKEKAEDIIRQQNKSRRVTASDEEIAREAEKLSKRYNKLVGIRDGSEGITLSLSNAPFGDKLFKWTGVADKRIQLTSGDKLRKLSEASGIALTYAKVRDAIYGSQIGRLFSNNASLYKLSKEDPGKLYDFIQFVDHTRGLRADKLALDKAIMDKAKALDIDLTPAEKKQLLDALQDKTIWAKVTKTVKFRDTKKAQELRELAENKKEQYRLEIEELEKFRENIDQLTYATENKLFDARGQLDELRNQYRESLADLLERADVEEAELQRLIKMTENELSEIDKDIALRKSLVSEGEVGSVDKSEIVRKIGIGMEELKKMRTNRDGAIKSKIDELSSQIKEIPEEYRNKVSNNKNIAKELQEIKDHNKSIREQIRKFRDDYSSGATSAKRKLIDTINDEFFGQKWIGYSTDDEALDDLVKMIRSNKSIRDLETYIEENHWKFSGIGRTINSFIAELIGYGQGTPYKNWDEYFTKRIEALEEIYKRDGSLHRLQIKDYQKLLADRERRAVYRARLLRAEKYGGVEGIQKEMAKISSEILEKEIVKDEKLWNSTAFEYKTKDTTPHDIVYQSSGVNRHVFNAPNLDNLDDLPDTTVFNDILEDLLSKAYGNKNFDINKVNDAWFAAVADEVKSLLKNKFKRSYSDLTPKQKDFLLSLAFKNTSDKFATGKTAKSREKIAKELERKMFEKAQEIRVNTVIDRVKEGSNIRFISGGRVYRGDVISHIKEKDGAIRYFVQTKKGDVIETVPNDVMEIIVDNTRFTPDELIMKSPLSNEIYVQRKAVVNQLNNALKNIEKLKGNVAKEKKELIDKFSQRANEIKDNIAELEERHSVLRDTYESGEFENIEKLQKRIDEIENALASDDAFETYLRSKDPNIVDNAINAMKPDIDVVLREDLNLDEKVRTIVKALRYDFIQMGRNEVLIDKLNVGQFESLMYNYVPHILTEDGRRFFNKHSIVVDKDGKVNVVDKELRSHDPAITQDLGYGLKFNPFSKSRTMTRIFLDGEWITNPTIEQINQLLAPLLQGKNAFSEDIADIFLQRALKNSELIYDDNYMRYMLDRFGKDIKSDLKIEEGYKAVANFGMLKKHIEEVTNRRLKNALDERLRTTGQPYQQEELSDLYQNIYDSVLNSYGISPNMLDELATPMVELSEDQVARIYRADPSIVKQVNEVIVNKANQARKLSIAKNQNRFLQLYDKFTHWFKLNQTTVMPSFHARNKLSNMFLNWLAVGRDAFNWEYQKNAWLASKHMGDPTKVTGRFAIRKPDGTVEAMSWSDAYNLAKEYGVIDEGFFAADLGADAASSGIFKDKIPPKWNPTDTKNFVLYREGARFGSKIENSDRLIHFVSQLSRGMSVEDAAESSRKFLFDYSDLTAFEKTWMKRVIPYYTWLRKNARLQLSQMLENPKRYQYVAKTLSGVEGMNNEDERIDMNLVNDFARDWVQTPFSVTNPEGRIEPVLWNPNLPFMDIGRIPNPLDPINSLRELFTQTNPLLKVPIEQAMNYNAFFEDEIVEEGENPVAERADHALSQLALYNTGKGAVTKSGADWGLHVFNSLSGIKMLSYDYDKFKHQRIEELRKDME